MVDTRQLLAKALSTSSEEEAISCLHMARKKGGSLDTSSTNSQSFRGGTINQWYDKAIYYHKLYNELLESKIQPGGYTELWKKMYFDELYEKQKLKTELKMLKEAKPPRKNDAVFPVLFFAIFIVGIMIGSF